MVAQTLLWVIVLFLLLGIPSVSSALSVQINAGGTVCNPTPASSTGPTGSPRTTTLLFVAPFTCNGFQVTCVNCTLNGGNRWRVIAQQSSTITKITVSNTRIIAPSGLPANASVRITATSGNTNGQPDFLAVAAGGRPTGVVLSANFTGNPPGNRISVTGQISTNTTRIVNRSPAGSTDTARSLPKACAGNLSCVFTATSGTTNIYDSLTETIQLTCPTGSTTCTPVMRVDVDTVFAHGGDGVNLPNSAGCITATDPESLSEDSPAFNSFRAALQVLNLSKFAFESVLILGAGSQGINPVEESVQLAVGSNLPITMMNWRRRGRGFWTFDGVVENGVRVGAAIKQLDLMGTKFLVTVGGTGADLSGLAGSVPVRLTIGDQNGQQLVTPRFFSF